jgi:hypothetical protein
MGSGGSTSESGMTIEKFKHMTVKYDEMKSQGCDDHVLFEELQKVLN